MGLYSIMLDEQRIRDMVGDGQDILIISCPGCACESLSYGEGLPNRLLEQGKDMDSSAVAVNLVRTRWEEMLRAMGKRVDHLSVVFPCEMFDTERENILAALSGHDTVMILACGSAYTGIRDILSDWYGKIVPMMQTKGSFVFRLVKDESGKYSKVEQETARINRFGQSTEGSK